MNTVTATVTAMMAVALAGIRRRVFGWMLCQSNVPTETMTMTPTRAAIGMRPTISPRPTTSTRRNVPAAKVDSLVRARPDFTLIIVWPIMAQPPMPPNSPVTTFAMP